MKSKFGRDRDQRQLLMRNLATSVILYESVITTAPKGRMVQPIVERLIRIGMENDPLTARRRLLAYLPDTNAVNKILQELALRYKGRHSGFTKRIHVAPRKGDGAPQVLIQLTDTIRLATPEITQGDKKTKKAVAAKATGEGDTHAA